MNDDFVSNVIIGLTTCDSNPLKYPVIKFTLLQKIIKGRISTVITWSDFQPLAKAGILHKFFSQGLDINSVTTVVNNEVKLNLISQILQQGERIIGEYIRRPVCRLLLDHIFRMRNYAPISSWQSKDTILSISPYVECLEPQMLPNKQKHQNWKLLFMYIAASNEIEPSTCLTLLYRLDRNSWSRITTETKFLCLRFAPPQVANRLLWHWEEKYETELAKNGLVSSMQDMALQRTLNRAQVSDDLSEIKRRNEKLFQLVCTVYLHLLNYDEMESLFGMYYVSIDWDEISRQQVDRMEPRAVKQTLEYIKDHRLSPQSQWSERDLKIIGNLITGLSPDEITQSHIPFFYRNGGSVIRHLSLPQKVKLISLVKQKLSGFSSGLTLSDLRDYDISLLNCLSARNVSEIISSTFESGYFVYSPYDDRMKEMLPTELLSEEDWDERISSIIYDNAVKTILKSDFERISLSGPLSESLGPILHGATYDDLIQVRYSEWLSVINSFQFFLGKQGKMSRGLAQTLATYFEKVANDLFGPNKSSERHMAPSFRNHMHLLGGNVLRELNPNFFLNVPAYLCREAISLIGELKDNIMLPRKMRQNIVRVYLSHCTRSPQLDFVDLVSLGSLICDVPADFLEKRANHSLLRERVHYFKQCSLDLLQGQIIKQLLPQPIISYQNILNLQSTMCSFISAKQLMMLNDSDKEDIAPALPYLWKQHPALFSSSLRFSDLLWDPELAFLEGLDVESQQQLGNCIRTSAWTFATDFKPDLSYYSQKECNPSLKETWNTVENSSPLSQVTCAQLKDLGAGIAVLPEEFFDNMNSCQLKRCINYLTTHQFLSESVTSRLFTQLESSIRKQYSTNDSLPTFATTTKPLLWYDLPVLTSFMDQKDFPNIPTAVDFLYLVQKTLPTSSRMPVRKEMLEYLFSRFVEIRYIKYLSITEISVLGNILCGSTFKAFSDQLMLSTRTNIARILPSDFHSSLHFLGNLTACDNTQLSELSKFYEQSGPLFGPIYGRADIIDLNLIISALQPTKLNSLERDQIKMISCDAIRRIPESNFAQLSQLFFLRLSPEQIRCFTRQQWKHAKSYKLKIANNILCSHFQFSQEAFTCTVTGNEFPDKFTDESELQNNQISGSISSLPSGKTEDKSDNFDIDAAIDSSITVQSRYPLTDLHYLTVFAFKSYASFFTTISCLIAVHIFIQ